MDKVKQPVCYSKISFLRRSYFVKHVIFICLYLFSGHTGHAQVNLQTGSATFSLPMFNWQDDKGRLKSVVAINYSSGGGLKVNDVASNVGQGWNLVAGGVITRLQEGEPDDQQAHGSDNNIQDLSKYPAGLMYSNVSGAVGCPGALTTYPIFKGMNQLYTQRNATAIDRQQDVFSFEFNGKSGMFAIGRDGTVWPIGDTRLTISIQTDGTMANNGIRTTIKSFTITDVDGLIYKFGTLGSANTPTTVDAFCGLTKVLQEQFCDASGTNIQKQPTFQNGGTYYQAGFDAPQYANPWVIGSWYLAEIDDPFTARKVSFSYVTSAVTKAPAGINITNNQGSKNYVIIDRNLSTTLTPNISSISYPDGHTVNFNYSASQRIDYAGQKALASVDILYLDNSAGATPINRFLSEYQLNTTYFILNRYGTPVTPYQQSVARLCLKSVKKIGVDLKEDSPPFIFDYYLNSGTANTDDFIPPPFFYAKDIFGYYNGSNSTGFSGGSVPLNTSITGLNFDQLKGLCFIKNGVSGIVINPKAGYAQNGLLKQIVYPTGGATTYQYAQNVTGTSTLNGGVHVSQTSTTDGGYSNGCGNPVTTQYNYVMNGAGSASSLWGTEQPVNTMTMLSHYAPEHKTFHFSWSCGACCYWHFQYPGIMNQYQTVSLEGFQNFMNAIAPVLTIIGVITDIMDVATVVGGATGFGAIAAVVIDAIGIVLGVVLTCFGGSGSQDSSTTVTYNANLNDISPLPKQFMRLEIVQSPGGIGKTVQTFTSQNEYPIWAPTNPGFTAMQRFAPWAYGLPDSTMVYDSTGNLLKKTKNVYNFALAKHRFSSVVQNNVSHPDLTSCKCTVIHSYSQNSDSWSGASGYNTSSTGDMTVSFYDTYTGRTELDTTYEDVYSTVNRTQYTETKTAYSYNSRADTSYVMATPADNYDVKQIATWQSNGDTSLKTIAYPGDYNLQSLLNTGLIAHWPLSNSSNDISGNNHNGTLTNVMTTADRFGVANNALLFDGSSSQMTVSDGQDLHLYNTDYTISVWVRLDGYNTGLNSAILSRRGAVGSSQGFILMASGINSINSGGLGATTGGIPAFNNGSASYTWTSSPMGLSQWHLVTTEYSLSSQTFTEFLDGVQVVAYTGVATNPNTSYPLTIGYDAAAVQSNSGGYYFQGAMSDMRIYNRALSTAEIQLLNNSSSLPSSPTILYTLFQHNIASVPVETYTWEKKAKGQGTKYLGEKVTEFSQLSNGDIQTARVLEQRFAQPVSSISLYTGPGNSTNPVYKQLETFNYNNAGKLTGTKDEGAHSITSIYDYNDKYITASVINADPVLDNPAYTSFETPFTGGWTVTGATAQYVNSAITGTKSFPLGSGPMGSNSLSAPMNTAKPYTLSFWATAAITVSAGATLTKSAPTINGFTYYEYSIAQGTASISLSGTANIDELRLYPTTARMRTTTYDPLIGKTSECDENNRITYYQYDNLGRLRFIEDENKNVLKMLEYNNVSSVKQTGCPATFYNPLIAESFYRSNCGAGYYGDTATYLVPANKYSSTISQGDADAKAEVDLLVSGPAYANAHGACRLIYYNAAQSETDSSLICGAGKQGKLITYTVPAHTYSSFISQAFADSLAMADVAANAKANANSDTVNDCTVSTAPDWESSETTPVFTCSGGNEIIQQTDMNPNSPTYGQTMMVNEGPGDGVACSTCTLVWDPSITNTINSQVSFSGNTGTFNLVFFPPAVGYTGGTIGHLQGGCVPSATYYVTVPDNASNGTRTWEVIFYSTGAVTIYLNSGPAPTTTTVPISISGTFLLGSSLSTGLIAYWPFSGTANDASGNNHNGTLSNVTSTTDRHGVANNALLFNGSSSLISVSDGTDLHLTNTDYTISAWVRLDAYNAGLNSAILSRRGSTGANQGYVLIVSGVNSLNSGGQGPTTGGKPSFNNGSASYTWSSTPVGLSQWHLLTETYSLSSQTLTEYLDGVLVNTYTGVVTNPNTSWPLTIGYDEAANQSFSGGYYFQGAMSDMRIYNRVLTTTEIQQLYNP